MWLKIGEAVVAFLHWCTGWLVHPDKGGCCTHQIEDSWEDVKDIYNDITNDEKKGK